MKDKIGEQILVAQGGVRLGTKPGFFDRILGEKDVRRRIINGENINHESDEYKLLCEKAYDEFEKKCKDEGGDELFDQKLAEVTSDYHSKLAAAEENDKVKKFEVFASSTLLLNRALGLFSGIARTDSKPSMIAERDENFSSIFPESNLTAGGGAGVFERNRSEDNFSSYAATAVKTSNDILSWLSERSGGAPYGMVTFAAMRMGGVPLKTAAAISAISSLPKRPAVKLGDKDYLTTVYCGFEIICERLREAAKAGKIELIEDAQDQKAVEGKHVKTQRLVIEAHGDDSSYQGLTSDLLIRADDVAAVFFPNVKIIHASGCMIGTNPRRNFGINSLKTGQILCIHAGKETVSLAFMSQVSSFLTLQPNSDFPSSIPIQILFKKSPSKTIFTELKPPSLENIINEAGSGSKEQKIDNLYNLMARHISAQKELALEKFAGHPENRLLIKEELERLGFRDFTKETDQSKKAELVRDYLGKYIYSLSAHDNISAQDDNIEILLKSGLVDVNYEFDGDSLACMMASYGHEKSLQNLLENGAEVNKVDRDGLTPISMAAKQGCTECIDVLVKYNADLDHANNNHGSFPLYIATMYRHHEAVDSLVKYGAKVNQVDTFGRSSSYMAAEFGCDKCLQILAENGANLNKASKDGTTPTFVAALLGHDECLKILAENGADVNKARIDGISPLMAAVNKYARAAPEDKAKCQDTVILLIKLGANPKLTINSRNALEFAEEDKDLKKAMKKAYKEYKTEQKQKASGDSPAKTPNASPIKNSVEPLNDDRGQEHEL